MGFLKRFLSIGRSKKAKSKPADVISPVAEEPSDEVAMSQLLRASSLNFSVLAEREFRSLSPTGHTADQVRTSQPVPPVTPVRRNTYTVTIHRRVTLSTTEFPNANSEAVGQGTSTPSDARRLRKLRQDPSVVSLLNIYDDEGAPDPTAFSNSPRPNAFKTPMRSRSVLSKTPRSIAHSLRSIFGSVKTSRTTGIMSASPSSQLEHPQTPGAASRRRTTASLDATSFATPLRYRHSIADESCDITGLAGISTQAEAGSLSMSQTDISTILGPLRLPERRASQVFRFLKDPKELTALPPLPVETESEPARSPEPSPPASRTGSARSKHQVMLEPFLSEKVAAGPRGPRKPIPRAATFEVATTTRAVEHSDALDKAPIIRQDAPSVDSQVQRVLSITASRGPRSHTPPFASKSSAATYLTEDPFARRPASVLDWTIDPYKNEDVTMPYKEISASLTPIFTAPARPARNPSRMSSAASSSTNLPLPDASMPIHSAYMHKYSRSTSSLVSQLSTQPQYPEPEGSPTMRSKYAQRIHRQRNGQDRKPLFNDENAPLQGNVVRKESRKLRKRMDDAPFVDVFNSLPVTPVSQRVQHLTANGNPEKPSPASSSELSPATKQIMDNLRTKRRQIHHQAAGLRPGMGRGVLR